MILRITLPTYLGSYPFNSTKPKLALGKYELRFEMINTKNTSYPSRVQPQLPKSPQRKYFRHVHTKYNTFNYRAHPIFLHLPFPSPLPRHPHRNQAQYSSTVEKRLQWNMWPPRNASTRARSSQPASQTLGTTPMPDILGSPRTRPGNLGNLFYLIETLGYIGFLLWLMLFMRVWMWMCSATMECDTRVKCGRCRWCEDESRHKCGDI